jgi:hypothetical protein
MRAFSLSALILALAAGLLVAAAWRWHEAGAAFPDRIASVDTPSAVLLVQAWDCPDRQAAMVQWVRGIGPGSSAAALPVLLGVLGDEPGFLDPSLEALPRLDPHDVSEMARAVRRSGIPGTPALILLDGEGRVLLTDTFATDGPGPRLALAATLLPTIHPPSASGGPQQFDGR